MSIILEHTLKGITRKFQREGPQGEKASYREVYSQDVQSTMSYSGYEDDECFLAWLRLDMAKQDVERQKRAAEDEKRAEDERKYDELLAPMCKAALAGLSEEENILRVLRSACAWYGGYAALNETVLREKVKGLRATLRRAYSEARSAVRAEYEEEYREEDDKEDFYADHEDDIAERIASEL